MYNLNIEDRRKLEVEIINQNLTVDGNKLNFDVVTIPDGGYSVIANNKSYVIYIDEINLGDKTATMIINNHRHNITIQEPIDILLGKMGINLAAMKKAESIKAPMPGLILKILVTEGQNIKKGEPVLILEAMKMENVFKASADATVKSIKVEAGTAVEKGTILIELE